MEKNYSVGSKTDLKGRHYGELEILHAEIGEKERWRCACSCGNVIVATEAQITGGRLRSCGCVPSYYKKGKDWIAKLKRPRGLLFLGRFSNKNGFNKAWKRGQIFIHAAQYGRMEELRSRLHQIIVDKEYNYQDEEVRLLDAELQRVVVAIQRIERKKRKKCLK